MQYTRLTYRNLLLFYTLIMNHQKKQENNPIDNNLGKNKIARNELNQVGERSLLWILQPIDEGIWKWCKEIKRYHMSLDWENVVKMSILSKAIYRFNTIPIKISVAFFTEWEQMILYLLWTTKDSELLNHFWEKRSKARGIVLLDIILYRAIIIKAAWYRCKNGHTLIKRIKEI